MGGGSDGVVVLLCCVCVCVLVCVCGGNKSQAMILIHVFIIIFICICIHVYNKYIKKVTQTLNSPRQARIHPACAGYCRSLSV